MTINVPGAERFGCVAFGINDSGQVVGYYLDNNGDLHGFLATPIQ